VSWEVVDSTYAATLPAISRICCTSLSHSMIWFQLGTLWDAGPEITNGLGAFLYAAQSKPGSLSPLGPFGSPNYAVLDVYVELLGDEKELLRFLSPGDKNPLFIS
jgi:hypothetical protein